MGTAVAQRLLETGHEVVVWNRSPENAAEARAAGARFIAQLSDLVSESDVVITFLLDNAAVERVYLGPKGILDGPSKGKLFIDMSTVSPGTHVRVAGALSQLRTGFVECPVSGSVSAVRAGTLVGFAGGEAADVARAKPVLSDLCRRLEHVGPLGSGARMKLAANLLLVVFWQALGESLSLAGPPGIDAARAIDLLADSNIGAGILRARASQIVAAMKGDSDHAPAAFDVDTMLKDLRYMADEAAAQGRSLPLASRTFEVFDRASRDGGGGVDAAEYPAYWVAHQRAAAALNGFAGNAAPPTDTSTQRVGND